MKKILFVIMLITATSLFAQEKNTKPDSTNYKKIIADLQQLQTRGQALDDAKYKFLGQYYEQLQGLQKDFQTLNAKLEEEKNKLNKLKENKNESSTKK